MWYLKEFDTKQEHDAAYNGADYDEPWTAYVEDTEEVTYNNKDYDWSQRYLTFEAVDDCVFTFTFPAELPTSAVASFSYSVDNGETWTTTNNVNNTEVTVRTPTVKEGEKILFKGIANSYTSHEDWAGTETSSTGSFIAYGNIMSLLYGDDFVGQDEIEEADAFYAFFGSDEDDMVENGFGDKLLSVENLSLPATTLSGSCYRSMFYGCTSLTTAPVLPATTLVNGCYSYMFDGCAALTTAPALPATTLVNSCYYSMFQNCTSLTTAPALPATTLASQCYYRMFNGCTSLNYIKAMFTTTPSSSYTSNWVSGVATTGTFVKNSAATWTTTGANGVPSGWTVQTASE